ncbi:ABC transporter permease [Neobacillus notoginsengisoli]|uniref:ABC transporter permease n=1 Tax=Neobacillus notoginsengisoli TaxID=1578198 RepID=A0A417YS37_9BACI|nr:FtsX-like permease family protein [Neobacillus notoginsengisoli]RHW38101.1 ABC transporter permease [Neobacillus notoginsengisoli]
MKLKDQFRFVRQNMKKSKTRIFMTILAAAMGTAFLIVLASVGFGLHSSIVKEITGRQIVTEIQVHGKQNEESGFQGISDEDIAKFEKMGNVKSVVRRKSLQQDGIFRLGNYEAYNKTVVAHMPSELKAGFELAEGRVAEKDNEIILGYNFIDGFLPNDTDGEQLYDNKGRLIDEFKFKDSLIGKTLTMTVNKMEDGKEVEKTFDVTVVGIRKQPTKEWVFDRTVFISDGLLKQIEEFTGTPRGAVMDPANQNDDGFVLPAYDEVKVYATNLEAVKGITEKLEKDDYMTYSVLKELKEVDLIFTIVKAGLIFIGTIAVLIASIGIYNTMTMAVTERSQDIGIMKAIGANPKTIKSIFLLESSYIGIIGALIGTAVAYLISFAVNLGIPLIIQQAFGEEPPKGLTFSSIPWTLPVISFVICYVVTILSGLRPAQRATKVDVLSALRREV